MQAIMAALLWCFSFGLYLVFLVRILDAEESNFHDEIMDKNSQIFSKQTNPTYKAECLLCGRKRKVIVPDINLNVCVTGNTLNNTYGKCFYPRLQKKNQKPTETDKTLLSFFKPSDDIINWFNKMFETLFQKPNPIKNCLNCRKRHVTIITQNQAKTSSNYMDHILEHLFFVHTYKNKCKNPNYNYKDRRKTTVNFTTSANEIIHNLAMEQAGHTVLTLKENIANVENASEAFTNTTEIFEKKSKGKFAEMKFGYVNDDYCCYKALLVFRLNCKSIKFFKRVSVEPQSGYISLKNKSTRMCKTMNKKLSKQGEPDTIKKLTDYENIPFIVSLQNNLKCPWSNRARIKKYEKDSRPDFSNKENHYHEEYTIVQSASKYENSSFERKKTSGENLVEQTSAKHTLRGNFFQLIVGDITFISLNLFRLKCKNRKEINFSEIHTSSERPFRETDKVMSKRSRQLAWSLPYFTRLTTSRSSMYYLPIKNFVCKSSHNTTGIREDTRYFVKSDIVVQRHLTVKSLSSSNRYRCFLPALLWFPLKCSISTELQIPFKDCREITFQQRKTKKENIDSADFRSEEKSEHGTTSLESYFSVVSLKSSLTCLNPHRNELVTKNLDKRDNFLEGDLVAAENQDVCFLPVSLKFSLRCLNPHRKEIATNLVDKRQNVLENDLVATENKNVCFLPVSLKLSLKCLNPNRKELVTNSLDARKNCLKENCVDKHEHFLEDVGTEHVEKNMFKVHDEKKIENEDEDESANQLKKSQEFATLPEITQSSKLVNDALLKQRSSLQLPDYSIASSGDTKANLAHGNNLQKDIINTLKGDRKEESTVLLLRGTQETSKIKDRTKEVKRATTKTTEQKPTISTREDRHRNEEPILKRSDWQHFHAMNLNFPDEKSNVKSESNVDSMGNTNFQTESGFRMQFEPTKSSKGVLRKVIKTFHSKSFLISSGSKGGQTQVARTKAKKKEIIFKDANIFSTETVQNGDVDIKSSLLNLNQKEKTKNLDKFIKTQSVDSWLKSSNIYKSDKSVLNSILKVVQSKSAIADLPFHSQSRTSNVSYQSITLVPSVSRAVATLVDKKEQEIAPAKLATEITSSKHADIDKPDDEKVPEEGKVITVSPDSIVLLALAAILTYRLFKTSLDRFVPGSMKPGSTLEVTETPYPPDEPDIVPVLVNFVETPWPFDENLDTLGTPIKVSQDETDAPIFPSSEETPIVTGKKLQNRIPGSTNLVPRNRIKFSPSRTKTFEPDIIPVTLSPQESAWPFEPESETKNLLAVGKAPINDAEGPEIKVLKLETFVAVADVFMGTDGKIMCEIRRSSKG